MKQCMDSQNLHRRLKKIIGQVQAIDRMVDEDVPCEDVLSLINAAKSALNGCGKVVLEGHIKHCVRDGIEHGDAEKPSRASLRLWSASPICNRRKKPADCVGFFICSIDNIYPYMYNKHIPTGV